MEAPDLHDLGSPEPAAQLRRGEVEAPGGVHNADELLGERLLAARARHGRALAVECAEPGRG